MDELFRYAVVRPLERRTVPRLPLEHPPGHEVGNLQQQLRGAAEKKDWYALEEISIRYIQSNAARVLKSPWLPQVLSFYAQLQATPADLLSPDKWPTTTWPAGAAQCAVLFNGQTEQQGGSELQQLKLDLTDLFLALLILRASGPGKLDSLIRGLGLWNISQLLGDTPSLTDLADAIRAITLILLGRAAIQTAADVTQVLRQTLLVPGGIFSPFEKPVHSIGCAQLHLVKQHVRGYELGEIARIENILKGESREHSLKHSLTNEQTTLVQTETTTTNQQDLTSRDQVSIKNDADNITKTDTKVNAGVQLSFGQAGSYQFKSNLAVSYDDSSSQAKKFASETAKDVTARAVKTVTQRVLQSQQTVITEKFEEDESQSFDNKPGLDHVSGVYQWVEKVYLAQTFQYGKRVLFDIMVPEPAASLLAESVIPPANRPPLVPPDPLGTTKKNPDGTDMIGPDGGKILDVPLEPLDLSEDPTNPNFYGTWVAKFGVGGVEPPATPSTTVTKPILFPYVDDDIKQASDTLRINDGYGVYQATVSLDCLRNDNPSSMADVYVDVTIGTKTLRFPWPVPGRQAQMSQSCFLDPQYPPYPSGGPAPPPNRDPITVEVGTIGYTVYGPNINQMSVNIELECRRLPVLTAQWQLQTFEKIAAAWQKMMADYKEALKEQQLEKGSIGPLGAADPLRNREIEQTEIKRACIAILDNSNEIVRGVPPKVGTQIYPQPGDTTTPPVTPALPEPILPSTPNTDGTPSQELGASVRWFEQAFEWQNVGYIFYPYFWGRRSTWIDKINLFHDDATFLQFLQAGYARVVVPVREGFEEAMQFYLITGRPWLGGDLPHVGDDTQNPLYLDLAEELKEQSGAPGDETPSDDPWEIRLPTSLIKLQKDNPAARAADSLPEWHRPPGLPSNEAPGYWTWLVGPPPP